MLPDETYHTGEKVLKKLTKAPLPVCKNAKSFLQSDFWGAFKSSFAWMPYSFHAEWADFKEQTPLLVIYR
ncbi:MAG: hypothetical protein LBJ35_05685, partial [Spirochaetaceae bacterium]|nr:hypothetical protein [Spirochaetaceae bacterium]